MGYCGKSWRESLIGLDCIDKIGGGVSSVVGVQILDQSINNNILRFFSFDSWELSIEAANVVENG